jgi:hypothetical protein
MFVLELTFLSQSQSFFEAWQYKEWQDLEDKATPITL